MRIAPFGVDFPVLNEGLRFHGRWYLRCWPCITKEATHEIEDFQFGAQVVGDWFRVLESQQKGCTQLGRLV